MAGDQPKSFRKTTLNTHSEENGEELLHLADVGLRLSDCEALEEEEEEEEEKRVDILLSSLFRRRRRRLQRLRPCRTALLEKKERPRFTKPALYPPPSPFRESTSY